MYKGGVGGVIFFVKEKGLLRTVHPKFESYTVKLRGPYDLFLFFS